MIFLLLLYYYYHKKAAQKAAQEATQGTGDGAVVTDGTTEGFVVNDASSANGIEAALWALISLFIGIYAVYLSWSCNTKEGVSVIGKIFFAFWAWVFGLFYLIFYWIVRSASCGSMS